MPGADGGPHGPGALRRAGQSLPDPPEPGGRAEGERASVQQLVAGGALLAGFAACRHVLCLLG